MLAVADVALPAGACDVAQPDDRPAAALGGIQVATVREAEHVARLLRRDGREAARANRAPGVLEQHLEPASVRRAVLEPHRGRAGRGAHVPRGKPRLLRAGRAWRAELPAVTPWSAGTCPTITPLDHARMRPVHSHLPALPL